MRYFSAIGISLISLLSACGSTAGQSSASSMNETEVSPPSGMTTKRLKRVVDFDLTQVKAFIIGSDDAPSAAQPMMMRAMAGDDGPRHPKEVRAGLTGDERPGLPDSRAENAADENTTNLTAVMRDNRLEPIFLTEGSTVAKNVISTKLFVAIQARNVFAGGEGADALACNTIVVKIADGSTSCSSIDLEWSKDNAVQTNKTGDVLYAVTAGQLVQFDGQTEDDEAVWTLLPALKDDVIDSFDVEDGDRMRVSGRHIATGESFLADVDLASGKITNTQTVAKRGKLIRAD